MEITYLFYKDFKVTVISIANLWKSIDDFRESYNKEIEKLKKSHSVEEYSN